jgi:hypothetical protein
METLDQSTIRSALECLNERLRAANVTGEICIYGGGAMILAFNARLSTKDLDAVFQPVEVIRQAAAEVALEKDIRSDWINDGVKGFVSNRGTTTDQNVPQFSNLRVTRPTTKYLLAMKCLAARAGGFETQGDRNDVRFLIQELNLRTAADVLAIVEEYYDERLILPKTRFLVEELIGELPSTEP